MAVSIEANKQRVSMEKETNKATKKLGFYFIFGHILKSNV